MAISHVGQLVSRLRRRRFARFAGCRIDALSGELWSVGLALIGAQRLGVFQMLGDGVACALQLFTQVA